MAHQKKRNPARVPGKSKSLSHEWVHSYIILTINGDAHSLMNQFHKPTDEKRMVVVLPEAAYDEWLVARPELCEPFLVPFAAQRRSG